MNLINFITQKLDDLKATDILHLDVRGKCSICDDMVICTGSSSRQVTALAEKLIAACKAEHIDTFGEEGKNTADWIVVDLGLVLVHIMQGESRDMYQLEKLWS